jgi:hypothetical protein
MAGRGPAPKPPEQRRRSNTPARNEWRAAGGEGWQHGEVPKPPAKLTKGARDAWEIWFGAWFAWFWEPEDLPGLRQLVRLYDQVERGEFQRHSELRLAMDSYGITPKGQQDRRWMPAAEDVEEPDVAVEPEHVGGRFAGLKIVKPA